MSTHHVGVTRSRTLVACILLYRNITRHRRVEGSPSYSDIGLCHPHNIGTPAVFPARSGSPRPLQARMMSLSTRIDFRVVAGR